MSDLNPYAAPKARIDEIEGESGPLDGVWSDGSTLVLTKKAELPPRCLKCNEPADHVLNRSLSWHPPWVAVLVLLSPLIYIVVALIIRQTAKVAFPLCGEHLSRRRKAIALGWLASLAGLSMIIGGVANAPGPVPAGVAIAGGVLFLVGIIWGVVRARIVKLTKIDKRMVYLDRVDPGYLAELPTLPLYMKDRSKRGR
jgi:hypothetical protein